MFDRYPNTGDGRPIWGNGRPKLSWSLSLSIGMTSSETVEAPTAPVTETSQVSVDVSTTPFPVHPPPWRCDAEAYWIPFKADKNLPDFAYAPLEAASPTFSNPEDVGEFAGGLGMIQLLRYSSTPVGPYDEMVIIPGYFKPPNSKKNPSLKKDHIRITRIYVNQKETTYNGRRNWNIPKHLAKFSFTDIPADPTKKIPAQVKIEVFPEHYKSTTPFFTTTIVRAWGWPGLPMSTTLMPWLGFDLHLVQPPLPTGKDPELVGSDKWIKCLPVAKTNRARVMWFDMKQVPKEDGEGEGEGKEAKTAENFWPGFGRWRLGLWLEKAEFVFVDTEVL